VKIRNQEAPQKKSVNREIITAQHEILSSTLYYEFNIEYVNYSAKVYFMLLNHPKIYTRNKYDINLLIPKIIFDDRHYLNS
jgi:hypothetical protein